MTKDTKYKLILPKSDNTLSDIKSNSQSILLIGANGSGKTRLGAWFEMKSPQLKSIHRISAQKSLAMPDSITPVSIERAEKDLLFGHADSPEGQGQIYREGSRWGGKPAISMLNDFQKLMVYLFSNETEENAKFKILQKNNNQRIEPPLTKLDLIKEVWEKILPHRELIIGGLRIQTRIRNSPEKIYNSSEMSDGERVIFYLIGQCLAAPKDGIIVIDEPELHLHKSVQIPLWVEIERLRQDCLFIYLTHDVDFAAAKENSKRIWIKSFDGQHWDWEELVENDLPGGLLLEVLGSRKPVVFVEGDNGSHDISLYRAILPSFLVIPRGSCTQVIQSVKAFKSNVQLHNLSVFGVIDRDRRVQAEISALEKDSIYVLDVAEVENLFCTKEVLHIVSSRLSRDPAADFKKISTSVFKKLKTELDTQISLRVAGEIKFKLNFFNEKAKGEKQLTLALKELHESIDISSLYQETSQAFNDLISKSDYKKLLMFYNRKTLSAQISTELDLANGGLPELVVRLAQTDLNHEITNALINYFGNFKKIALTPP
ncbi:DUF4435 domain-containing protein [Pseudomonas sp. Xaverov 83]|uniref:DUF4435 domain-containing protein n=1 Tax=Pseudomonas sp. Xaverov 83 TaxID=2666087 RepID=UPI001C5BDFF2|nr:DUF4435 domain-containing protein [Pseudomonas sp. Xaverov 83]